MIGKVSPVSVLVSAFQRHLPIALLTFFSTLGASSLYLFIATPLYESSLQLMFEEKEISLSNLGRSLLQLDGNPATGVSSLATQAELITSQKVLSKALNEISQKGFFEPEELPTLEDLKKRISVKIVPATHILALSYANANRELAAQLLNAVAQSMVEENAAAIRREASSVRQFLETKIPEQQARLDRAETVERDYRQANGIVSIEAQTQSLVDALSTVSAEERSLRAQLREATEKKRLLQQVTGMDSLGTAYQTIQVGQNRTLNDLNQRLVEVGASIAAARSRLGDRHPDLLALYDQQRELNQLYNQELSRVTSQALSRVNRSISSQSSQELIAQYITEDIAQQALTQRLAVIQAEQQQLQEQLTQLPRRQQPLADLVRQRQEAENALQFLQNKLEEVRIAEAQLVSNIRVMGLANVPDRPASPQPLRVLLVGALTGLLVTGGTVFLLEMLDGTVRSAAEVESALQLSTLSVLPKLPFQRFDLGQLEEFLDHAELVEPYRVLLKRLEYQCQVKGQEGNFEQPKSVTTHLDDSQSLLLSIPRSYMFVVSSCIAEEGKSAVAIHLAAVAAMLGRRVLIVDADLRHPIQSSFFDLPPFPGLTEAVSTPQNLVRMIQFSGLDNLFVLPHGRSLSRPSVLSEAKAMQFVLKTAAEQYDWVIVDASTLHNCADAVTLSQYTDGLILVVRPGFVRQDILNQILSDLRSGGGMVLGSVLNETIIPEEEEEFHVGKASRNLRQWLVRSRDLQNQNIGSIS